MSASDATLKQAKRVLELFDEINATADQVQQLLGSGDLLKQMMQFDLHRVDRDAFARLLESSVEGIVPDWYVNPQQQRANVWRWNKERGWGLTETDFPAIPDGLLPRGPLEVPVLAVYLPDSGQTPGYLRTAAELWDIATGSQPDSRRGKDIQFFESHLRLLEGTERAHEPGIRWVMLDLGAHRDDKDAAAPSDVRDKDSAHAEVLAAAAHFPEWVRDMMSGAAPFVWLPGYRVNTHEGEWNHVPVLFWAVPFFAMCLHGEPEDLTFGNRIANPVRREL